MRIELVSPSGPVQVSGEVFGREYNEALVHQVVTGYLAGARQGTKQQKTRSDVRGGGAKPWRQKGTGRARAGTSRSVLWRSGGVTFAARPRDFGQKINRKMYRAAMQVILSELVRQGRLTLVDSLELPEPKTKLLATKLSEMGVENALLISDELSMNLFLASRNIPNVTAIDTDAIDPASLVGHKTVVATVAAVKKLEESFA
ncbi:MAG: 50S ribosomal protein L4 [Pseudomonadales bacterium]|nr:50S ribosomal protein L4 [Pseudomonadales bacterium]